MRVRALTFVCSVTLVATAALAGVASPSGAQQITAADCGTTTYRWLFWPNGHGALTSVPHAATEVPHVDVYTGKGKTFSDAQNVGYADGTTTTTGTTCTPVTPAGGGSGTLKSTTQAKQLVCTFTTNPMLLAVPSSTVDQPSLSALVDGNLLVHAQLGTPGVGSSLDYDAKSCKLTKLPK